MLPLGGLFALIGRQLGKALNLAFAWATTALFGRVPKDKAMLLSGMALGSLLWPVVLASIVRPSVATFLLAFITLPSWAEAWVRPVMLVLAVTLPLAVGLLGSRLETPPPRGRALLGAALRGYPTAMGLFVVLLWMLVLAPATRLAAIARRLGSAHVAIAIKPGAYDTVVRDLLAALSRAGVPAQPARAHWTFEVPGRVLAVFGGERVRRLVPERLTVLRAAGVRIVVHPMDLALEGRREVLARARAAITRELTFTAANQTWTKEAQELEDALARAARGEADLESIARRIETVTLAHEEWEILYRLLLQVRLRLLPLASDAVVADREPEPDLATRLRSLASALRALIRGRRAGHRTTSPTGAP